MNHFFLVCFLIFKGLELSSAKKNVKFILFENKCDSNTEIVVDKNCSYHKYYTSLSFCTWACSFREDGTLFLIDVFTKDEGWRGAYLNFDFEKKKLFASVYPGKFYEKNKWKWYEASGDCNLKKPKGWFHVCLTWDGSRTKIYYNGQVLKLTRDDGCSSKHKIPKKSKIHIGNDDRKNTESKFFGKIYQYNVYSKCLSPKTIRCLSKCKCIQEGDIVSWKKLLNKEDNITYTNNIKIKNGTGPKPVSTKNSDCSTTECKRPCPDEPKCQVDDSNEKKHNQKCEMDSCPEDNECDEDESCGEDDCNEDECLAKCEDESCEEDKCSGAECPETCDNDSCDDKCQENSCSPPKKHYDSCSEKDCIPKHCSGKSCKSLRKWGLKMFNQLKCFFAENDCS